MSVASSMPHFQQTRTHTKVANDLIAALVAFPRDEPFAEAYLAFLTDYSFLGLRARSINVGLIHDSCGPGCASRSATATTIPTSRITSDAMS